VHLNNLKSPVLNVLRAQKRISKTACVAKRFKLRTERNTADSEGHSTGTQWELLKLSDIKPQMQSFRNCSTVSENMMGCWKSASRQTQADRRNKVTKPALSHSSEYYSQMRGTCAGFIPSSSVKKQTDCNQTQEHLFAVPVASKYITANTAQLDTVL